MKNDTHTLLLTSDERELLLKNVTLPNGIVARFRFALQQGDFLEITLSDTEMGEFLESLSAALENVNDGAFLDAVSNMTQRNTPFDPEDDLLELNRDMFPEDLPDAVFEKIKDLLKKGNFASADEAFAAVQELLETEMDVPMEEFGGLSPEQVNRLIVSSWDEPESVLQLSDGIGLEDLADSAMVHCGRRFLAAVAAEEPVRLTAKGNMNRKSIRHIAELTEWPGWDSAELLRYTKQPNEEDFTPVHTLRILLEFAGYLKLQKGKMSLTKAGRDAMDGIRAGEMQVRLFTAQCREFNLAYGDRLPEYPEVQETYGYILYRVSQLAGEPLTTSALCDHVYLDVIRANFFESQHVSHAKFALHSRILRPLSDFGLLSYQPLANPNEEDEEQFSVRATPLFHKMIGFKF